MTLNRVDITKSVAWVSFLIVGGLFALFADCLLWILRRLPMRETIRRGAAGTGALACLAIGCFLILRICWVTLASAVHAADPPTLIFREFHISIHVQSNLRTLVPALFELLFHLCVCFVLTCSLVLQQLAFLARVFPCSACLAVGILALSLR